MAEVGGQWDERLARWPTLAISAGPILGADGSPRASLEGRVARQRGGIPRYGTAQPTIFWNAGAATEPP